MNNSIAPRCPYCGALSKLVDSKEVYRKSYGMIWLCRPCKAWVGVHKNSPVHAPLGRLANEELRHWKKRAHAAFDPMWKQYGMSRSQAYLWLQIKLNKHADECHIGMFDVETCKEVMNVCREYRLNNNF